jgi:hypothetical protein
MRLRPTLLLPLTLALVIAGSVSIATSSAEGPIRAQAIPLDRDAPNRVRVGALRFLSGWVLRSNDREFGGISSMVADDAGNFLAITDRGTLIRFRVGPDGVLPGGEIRPLPGNHPAKLGMNDAEAVTTDPAPAMSGWHSRTATASDVSIRR